MPDGSRQQKKAGEEVNKYAIRIEIPDGKVRELLERSDAAQQEIYNCYRELDELGVLTMQQVDEERTASGN